MSDVKCPYCKEEQEICHDDGQGYEDSEEHEQMCIDCRKDFKFTTSISYDYEVLCQDGDHKLSNSPPLFPDLWDCENCDYYEVRR